MDSGLILDLGPLLLAGIACAAFLSGVLHGSTGMAGGIVMATILTYFINIKIAVPIMTVALIVSHFSRTIMYSKDTDWRIAGKVLTFGGPTIIVGAIIFSAISPKTILLVFAAFLIASVPIKYWAKHNKIETGPKLLAGASATWGLLAGNVIGPSFFLAPFLLGTGMNRLTFVGTLASITLVMNCLKLSVFGATDLMSWELVYLGLGIGLITVPGNWVGRTILQSMGDKSHGLIIDGLTIAIAANFLYLAFR